MIKTFIFQKHISFVCVFVHIHTHTWLSVYGVHRDQKRVLDSLKFQLQIAISDSSWVLGIKHESSARASTAPNHKSMSQYTFSNP